jgi:hypothetical protein
MPPGGAVKDGVTAALAKLIAHDPSYTHAVVFDTTWWPPDLLGEAEQWDYEPFTVRAEAERRMRDPRSEEFAEPELWERREDGWGRTA